MRSHHSKLHLTPVSSRYGPLIGSDDKVALVRLNSFSCRHREGGKSLRNLWAGRLPSKASLLEQFTNRRLFKRLARVESASWGRPKRLTGESTILVLKAEQQQAIGWIQNKQAR